jgi:hypothetical protein
MPSVVHVKKRLSDVSFRFPLQQQYCGMDFFLRKNVEHLTDQIVKWSKANLLRLDELSLSAPDDQLPPEVELELAPDDSYQCRVYAVRAPDKVITKRNADPAVDFDVERTFHVRQRMDIRMEYLRIKQVLRNTAINTNNLTLTTGQQFDNTTSGASLPVSQGRTVVTQMKLANGGFLPNIVRMTSFVKNAIVQSEEMKDFTKFAVAEKGMPVMDEEVIAAAWGLAPGSVKCSDAIYTIAAPTEPPASGTQSAANPIWRTFLGSDIVFAYVVPIGLRTYGLGAEFRFSGYNTDPYAIISVPQLNRGAIPGEDIRGITITDPHVSNADSLFLLKNCVNTSSTTYQGYLD